MYAYCDVGHQRACRVVVWRCQGACASDVNDLAVPAAQQIQHHHPAGSRYAARFSSPAPCARPAYATANTIQANEAARHRRSRRFRLAAGYAHAPASRRPAWPQEPALPHGSALGALWRWCAELYAFGSCFAFRVLVPSVHPRVLGCDVAATLEAAWARHIAAHEAACSHADAHVAGGDVSPPALLWAPPYGHEPGVRDQFISCEGSGVRDGAWRRDGEVAVADGPKLGASIIVDREVCSAHLFARLCTARLHAC